MPTPRLTDPYKDLPILNAWLREADHRLRHINAGLNGVFVATQIGGGGGGAGSDLFWQDAGGNALTTVNPFTDVRLPGFISLNGLGVNNTDATGYIPVYVDFTLTNTVAGGVGPPVVGGNEVRGVNATVRNLRLAADEPTQGWDFIGVQGTAVIDSGTTVNIIGKQIGLRGEVYAQNLAAAKVHSFLFGGQVSLSQIGTNNTITNAAGLVISQPASQGTGGTVTSLSGLWIQNQAATGLTVTNAYGIKIDGVDGYGRIKWPSLEIASQTALSSYILAYDTGTSAFKGFTIDSLTTTFSIQGTSRVQINTTGGVPSASATYDWGGSALRWNKFWGVDQNLSGNSVILGTETVTGAIAGGSYKVGSNTVIDASQNVTSTGTGSFSGALTSASLGTGAVTCTSISNTGNYFSLSGAVAVGGNVTAGGVVNTTEYQISATAVIDSSRNAVNLGTITCSSTLTVGGGASITGGCAAGSFAIGASTVIDGSQNISVTGFCNAASFKVGGTAGASFGPGPVASITVVNGLITAIS